jgi:uncharacterized membrane protein YkgB
LFFTVAAKVFTRVGLIACNHKSFERKNTWFAFIKLTFDRISIICSIYVHTMRRNFLKRMMAFAIGVSYFWFGALKFIPGMSPAETLVIETVDMLFFGIFPESISIYIVAVWEVVLGVLLFTGWKSKLAAAAVLVHMAFTFTPLFLMPDLFFADFPALTLAGQYIIKNLVFVVGAMFILSED